MSETRPPMTAGPMARALSAASAAGSSPGAGAAPEGGGAGRDFGASADPAPAATDARTQVKTAARGSRRRIIDRPRGLGVGRRGDEPAGLYHAAREPRRARRG